MPLLRERKRHKHLKHFFTKAGWLRYGKKCWREIVDRRDRSQYWNLPALVHIADTEQVKVLDRDVWQVVVRDSTIAGHRKR
jgi:hypothetical protein